MEIELPNWFLPFLGIKHEILYGRELVVLRSRFSWGIIIVRELGRESGFFLGLRFFGGSFFKRITGVLLMRGFRFETGAVTLTGGFSEGRIPLDVRFRKNSWSWASERLVRSVGGDDDSLEVPVEGSASVKREGIEVGSSFRGSRRGLWVVGPASSSPRGRFWLEACAATNERPTRRQGFRVK